MKAGNVWNSSVVLSLVTGTSFTSLNLGHPSVPNSYNGIWDGNARLKGNYSSPQNCPVTGERRNPKLLVTDAPVNIFHRPAGPSIAAIVRITDVAQTIKICLHIKMSQGLHLNNGSAFDEHCAT